MSSRHKLQDATGVQIGYGGILRALVTMTAAPVGGEQGYITGALWQNTAGAAGSALYVNTGNTTSATWVAIG